VRSLRVALALLLGFLGARPSLAQAVEHRRLLDEVVAVVEAQSITLSELAAETRIALVLERGAAVSNAPLSRGLLAASLRRLVQERIVLAEVDRLRLADQDRTELDKRHRALRDLFGALARYDQFLRDVEMTDDEVEAVLARELRVERYLDSRLRLASQLRESELSDAAKELGGLPSMSKAQRDALRQRLTEQKYERSLADLLADLRRRTQVRILDPIESPADASPEGQ
jgi:hypothetical protein